MSWILLLTSLASATTISQARISALKQFVAPTKITVGPDDQFQSTVDPTGKFIVFTHRADLVAHLRSQDLASGKVSELMPLNADSQDATFNRDGRLAFTFYKFNARGDVCFTSRLKANEGTLNDRQIECLKRPGSDLDSERSSPFWRGKDEIGYVVRDINTQNTRIVVESLRDHRSKTVAQGKVWAPGMQSGGRFLVYNSIETERSKRTLTVLDLANGMSRQVRLAIPGASGFAMIDPGEAYVYFSHFLNDTNSDFAIDGADNSVVFRLSLAKLFSSANGAALMPEQLTSVESSCSFPRPTKDKLFMTCAFENALDIYTLPASGTVPADWNAEVLENALRTSRTYGERVLVLNSLRYRCPASDMGSRLLANYVLADDTAAARFYLNLAPKDSFHALLKIYLEARELKKAQPLGEISRAFERAIRGFQIEAEKQKGEPRLLKLVQGHLRAMINELAPATTILKSINFARPAPRRLERFLYFQLADTVLALPKQRPELLGVYRQMVQAPELSSESRIYYAFNALQTIAEMGGDPGARLNRVQSLSAGAPLDVAPLFAGETAILSMERSKDDAAKQPYYQKLDQLMRASQGQYFLRKAMNVRAILNFSRFADFKYLEAIAANWLRDTPHGDTEFIYARDVVSTSALDEAYAYRAQNQSKLALGFYYSALSLTDDLEAHAGYLESEIAQHERSLIEPRYKFLVSHQFVDENMKFVEALLTLIDAEGTPASEKSSRDLDQAIAKLDGMTQNRNAAVRYLLLGYAYLEKMRRTANGLEFDNSYFERAHRNLMLAFDQGRENDRVRASALIDLGLLHQRAANFGLSARFFGLRKNLGFESPAEQMHFAWFYAKSLFHTFQYDLARRELADLSESVKTTPIRERQAFYSALAGQTAEAVTLYQKVLSSGEVLGDTNQAKVQLGYGYALFKSHHLDEAALALRASLSACANLKPIPQGHDRVLAFEPKRIQLIATGLLSQIGSDADRLSALKTRGDILASSEKVIDDWEPAVILNDLRRAELNDPAGAAADMHRVVQFAVKFADKNGYLGQAIYRTTINYLALGLIHPELYRDQSARIETLVTKSITAMEHDQPVPTLIALDLIKLKLMWSAFQTQVFKKSGADVKSILKSTEAKLIQSEVPARWPELQAYAKMAIDQKGNPQKP